MQWARVCLHTNLTLALVLSFKKQDQTGHFLFKQILTEVNIYIRAISCLDSSWGWRLRAVGQMRGCLFLTLCHAQLAWEGKMGDANLVNGAQMGAMCRPSQMAATTCLLCLAGNHCLPGKKAFTFIAPWPALRLPLRPKHRFYSALQNATEETRGRVYRAAI